jgi:hypothetical protein
MLARPGLYLAPFLAVLIAGCETAPPPPLSVTTALAPEAASEQVAAALENAGLTVERTADGLRATTTSASFIRCLPVMVGGGDDRRVFTEVRERRGLVDVRFAGNGRTTATWQTTYFGRYLNRVNNTPFEQPCESTGALERLIARALGG